MRSAARLPLIAVLVLGLTLTSDAPALTLTHPAPTRIVPPASSVTLFTATVPATTPPATIRTVLLWFAVVDPGV